MLIINVTNKRQNIRLEHEGGPLELGRGPQRTVKRIMLEDIYISRDQLLIEERDDGQIDLANLSQKRDINLGNGTTLEAGGKRSLDLPAYLGVGETQISVERDVTGDLNKASLQTIAPPMSRGAADGAAPTKLLELGESPPPEKLASWMERVLLLQQSAADTPESHKPTARA